MPNLWLFKDEPSNYSYDDLEREGSTIWDGVKNNWAQKNLRQASKGDPFLYYHTGKERAVVGLGEVSSDPYPDPESDKRVVVDVVPTMRLARPVGLKEIKALDVFADSPLVRMGRLSVVQLTAAQWKAIEKLAKS